MSSTKNKILVGTGKGLVVFKKTSKAWQYEKDEFLGMPISIPFVDERNNAWWVSIAHRHWGQKLHRSFDKGKTWEAISAPKYPTNAKLKNGKPASLRYVWSMASGGVDEPKVLYLGTEPGGLFKSEDGGLTFNLLEALWNHPSRKDKWFGAGRDYPYIHSVVVDPRDKEHFYIAVSCAGIFETKDGGATWAVRNEGLRADFLPEPYAKIGHDPHLLIACKKNPDVLWQQNHCGIFRSTNAGKNWEEVTDQNGLAVYGFALGIDHQNPDRAWVIPAISDEVRLAVDRSLVVCRTDDGGKTWQAFRKGLPQGSAYDLVLRHGLCVDENLLAFGTTNGNCYVSEDYGETWECIHHHLPKVNSICFA